MEAAARDIQLLKSESAATPLHHFKGKSSKTGKIAANSKPCYRCGKANHMRRFKDATCHKCQKKGHTAPVCQSKKPSVPDKKPSVKQQDNWVDLDDSLDSNDDLTLSRSDFPLPMNKVSESSAHPLIVELEINHKKVTMEIDTGTAVPVISVNTYQKFFSNVKLSKSTTYIGEPMVVVGEIDVQVKYGSQRCVPW